MSSISINPDIGLRELLDVAQSDQYSIQFSPMMRGPGGRQGGTFIRQAAPHKGFTKRANESQAEYFDRLEAAGHDGVAKGLKSAQQLRKTVGVNGKTGVALIKKDGDVYPVPEPAARLAEHQGTAEYVSSHNSMNEALDAQRKMTGETPALPSVY